MEGKTSKDTLVFVFKTTSRSLLCHKTVYFSIFYIKSFLTSLCNNPCLAEDNLQKHTISFSLELDNLLSI